MTTKKTTTKKGGFEVELPSTMQWSASQMAALLEVTPKRVKQLADDGVMARVGRGRYDMVKSVQNFVRWQRERMAGNNIIKADEEKQRLAKARAEIAEMDLEARREQLIDIELARTGYLQLATLLRQAVLSLSDRIAPLAFDAQSLRACRGVIRDESETILRELADSKPDWMAPETTH